MERLTKDQAQQVLDFLDLQGLSFDPLKNELLDHLLIDIEILVSQGKTFDESFDQLKMQFAKHHLLSIEQETMEAIQKQSILTTRITYLALGLLLITSAFKLLHLPGTTILLFTSLGAFALSLLTGAVTGIRRYKDKLGANMLYGVIGAVILHILAWAFLILQLPGEIMLRIISLLALVISFGLATYQFAINERFSNSILSYLHEKYTPGIERVLIIVLGVAAILKISALVVGYPPNVGMVLLVFVISGGVLHYFATFWQQKLTPSIALLLISLFVISMLPALGSILNLQSRTIFAALFYIAAGILGLYASPSNLAQKIVVAIICCFYMVWSLIHLDFISIPIYSLFTPYHLFFLISFYVLGRSNPYLRVYFITVIAHFLLEYPYELGFNF